MMYKKLFLAVLAILTLILGDADMALARVGGGRSMGSRGSRSLSPSRSAPSGSNYRRSEPAPARDPYSQSSAPVQPQPQRSGFWRGLGGGLMGGFLGSMLFNSIGHSFGLGGGLGGGGFGFLEIALLVGAGYLAFRWFRQQQERNLSASAAGAGSGHVIYPEQDFRSNRGGLGRRLGDDASQDGIAGPAIDKDEAGDIFFRIQGAWTRRNLSPVYELLAPEMARALEADLEGLKRLGQTNRLENIAIRTTETIESWNESNADFVTVRFTANLLDYTTDDRGSVIAGSDTMPVKFEEDWTFSRPSNELGWKLAAISQLS